jgi:predicted nucleic acid-binding protein
MTFEIIYVDNPNFLVESHNKKVDKEKISLFCFSTLHRPYFRLLTVRKHSAHEEITMSSVISGDAPKVLYTKLML